MLEFICHVWYLVFGYHISLDRKCFNLWSAFYITNQWATSHVSLPFLQSPLTLTQSYVPFLYAFFIINDMVSNNFWIWAWDFPSYIPFLGGFHPPRLNVDSYMFQLLDLGFCSLKVLKEDSLYFSATDVIVFIDHNIIDTLHENTFSGFPPSGLDVSTNNLASLDQRVFQVSKRVDCVRIVPGLDVFHCTII